MSTKNQPRMQGIRGVIVFPEGSPSKVTSGKLMQNRSFTKTKYNDYKTLQVTIDECENVVLWVRIPGIFHHCDACIHWQCPV